MGFTYITLFHAHIHTKIRLSVLKQINKKRKKTNDVLQIKILIDSLLTGYISIVRTIVKIIIMKN